MAVIKDVIHIGNVIFIKMEDVDDEFYMKFRQLMKEYGYQLPIDSEEDTSLSFDGLQLIPENYQVFRNGKEIALTGKEFEILMLLAQNRGRVFSKEQIYDAVWNNEYIFDERNMTAYINKIRRKIEPDPAHPRYIITVWGVGYKFNGQTKRADIT